MLTLAQTAICPAAHRHALFVTFDLIPGTPVTIARQAMANVAKALDEWAAENTAERACWAIGIGSELVGTLIDSPLPRELASFPQFADAIAPLPHTPHALLIHLRSEQADQCFDAGDIALAHLQACFAIAESTPAFRYHDGRDMTGFVDGTENPSLEERPEVALIDDDAAFNGGSYLHVQRFVHRMNTWRELPVAEQENVIGRTKVGDEEMEDDIKPASAHIARVVIEEDGEELQIVRQSMPYGTIGGERGLYFVSYCKTPRTFTLMLERMYTQRDGVSDRLLQYTEAVTGGAYFVPPRALFASWQ